jgi:acyl dehydratase
VHALVAMDMPEPGTVFLSQNWKFTAPVYIDDTITAEAEVISVHPSKPVTELRVQIKRSDGTIVWTARRGASRLLIRVPRRCRQTSPSLRTH